MILTIWIIGFIPALVFNYVLSRTPQGEYFLDRVVARGYIKGYHREKLRYAHVILASLLWFIAVPIRLLLKYLTGRWFRSFS